MKYALIVTLLLCYTVPQAQEDPCLVQLLKKPGTWIPHKNPESSAPADLAIEKKFTASVHDMIRAGYTPMGLDADYAAGFVREALLPYDSWFYGILALPYTCHDGKIERNHEGNTTYRVDFNQFGEAEIHDTTTDRQLTGFFNLRHGLPVEAKPGIWHFPESKVSLGFGMSGKSDLWLLTYDGKLPWAYVTKKEFLVKRKRNLNQLMAESEASTKEAIANIEKEKNLLEAQYKNDPAQWEKYLRLNYKPGLERQQKQLAGNAKPFEAAMEKIDGMLSLPASELEQIAIVKADPHGTYDYLFTDAKDPMAQILIKPDPGYFRKSPRHVPQFIQVELVWDPENPLMARFHDEVTKATNIDYIRSFIGKAAASPVPEGRK
jgi:hypothetical protein